MEPTIDQMASMTDEDFLKMEVPSDTLAPEKTPEEVARLRGKSTNEIFA